MAEIRLHIHDAEIRRMLAAGDRVYRRSGAQVLNRTADTIKSRSARGLASRMRLPLGEVRKRFYVIKASPNVLLARVRAYVRPFNPGPKAKQIGGVGRDSSGRYRKSKRGGGVRAYGRKWLGAFKMEIPSGGVIVAQRKPDAATAAGTDSRGRPRRHRLPVEAKKIEVHREANEIVGKVTARSAETMVNRDLPRVIELNLLRAAGRR